MGKAKELSPTKRAQIKILHEGSMSHSSIAKRLKISKLAVTRAIHRISELHSYKSRRSGRPRCTTPATDRLIHRSAVSHPTWSGKNIQAAVVTAPSVRTITRRLFVDFNLPSRRPTQKPRLSAKNIKDRVAVCKTHRNWTEDNWMNVLFSDESTFSQFASYVRHVRRPVNQRYNV